MHVQRRASVTLRVPAIPFWKTIETTRKYKSVIASLYACAHAAIVLEHDEAERNNY
jgi:hypothetical protein